LAGGIYKRIALLTKWRRGRFQHRRSAGFASGAWRPGSGSRTQLGACNRVRWAHLGAALARLLWPVAAVRGRVSVSLRRKQRSSTRACACDRRLDCLSRTFSNRTKILGEPEVSTSYQAAADESRKAACFRAIDTALPGVTRLGDVFGLCQLQHRNASLSVQDLDQGQEREESRGDCEEWIGSAIVFATRSSATFDEVRDKGHSNGQLTGSRRLSLNRRSGQEIDQHVNEEFEALRKRPRIFEALKPACSAL